MCKDIAEKKAIDYVGAYELIKHNKMKKECFYSEANSGLRTPKSENTQQQFYGDF